MTRPFLQPARKASVLLLLSALLLLAQLSGSMSLHAMTMPSSAETVHDPHCGSDMPCAALEMADCCADTLSDCLLECAQSTAWLDTRPLSVVLALVRALPPPVDQHWPEQPAEPPYQPPRWTAFG
ncbi:hypothetical protein [Marinobacterium weihaiense]|uniref:Uncharacterized protein n=1 Tax=Marinobacterium weihaiense TaxID=2851016 RepID=A0ABS6ME03_9GAMM|nr:hypothetical protein [Marinobacterium weihaiense]MBV0934503.1 hypothetical protein [Marinobacterium weihaiense]